MARAIDEKIVQMKMDDSDFTSKVRGVLSRFGDLDKGFNKLNGVNIEGPAKSIASVGTAVGSTTSQLNSMQSSLEFLANKFSVVGQVGQAAIARVTNSVIDLSGRVAKGGLIQPLIDGYNEYANKLKSINVIMNNLPDGSKDLGAVKNTLAQLNTYADKTIYSFEDMTTNMGTFTAAGVGLEDSAIAIQGIGNLAAASGSSTQQMSTAMYQLSQALASGKVGLQDWNSVVNAGMGGQKFQKALSQTAKELGHGRNEAISFRDSLQDGWLTSEVLLKTLQKFKNDKSMEEAATQVKTFRDLVDTTAEGLGSAWAQVWENIIGDSEEAPKLWTGIANAIQGPIGAMDAYNKGTSKAFHDLGGRQALIAGLTNVFSNLGKVLGAIGNAFAKVFPPATAKQLVDMAKGFENFTKTLKISKTDLQNISDTFQGLFTVVKWGINIIKGIAGILISLIPRNLFSVIESITGAIGRFIIKMDTTASGSKKLQVALDVLKNVLSAVRDILESLGSGIEYFASKLDLIGPKIKQFATPVIEQVKNIGHQIKESLAPADGGGLNVAALLGGISAGGIAILAKKIYDATKNITKSFNSVVDFFKKGGPLAGTIKNANELLGKLSNAITAFTGSIKVFALVEIAGALLGIALALKVLASIEPGDVFKSLEMLGVMLLAMNVSLAKMSNMKGMASKALVGAAALVVLAGAVDLIVAALYVFSKMKPEELIQGFTALTGVIIVMVGAIELLSNVSPKVMGAATALVPLALAIDMIAIAIAGLSFLDTDGVIQGVGAVAGVLLSLATFVKIVAGAKFGMGTAISIALLATAVNLMVIPIIAMGSIDFNKVATGLLELGALLLSLGVFAHIASGTKLMNAATSMVAVSIAVNLIAIALDKFGSIKMEDLGRGLIAMSLSLLAVVSAMVLANGSLSGAIAITIVAGALNLLVIPLEALGSMSLTQLVTAMSALAGSLIILGAAGYLLAPVVPALLGLALAITGLAVGIALIGGGIAAFAAGLLMLAGLGGGALVALGIALNGILDILIGMVPKLTELGTLLFRGFIDGIASNLPYLIEKVFELLINIIETIDAYGPALIQKGADMLVNLGLGFVSVIPELVTTMVLIITTMADALANNAQPLIDSGINLIISLINGMANGIRDNQDQIVGSVLNMVESILEIVITALTQVMSILFGWIPGFKSTVEGAGAGAKEALRNAFGIDGVANEKAQGAVDGVSSKKDAMNQAGSTLAQAGQKGLQTLDGVGVGTGKGSDFVNGLASHTGNAGGAGKGLSNAADAGARSTDIRSTGAGKGSDFVGGVGSQNSNSNGAGTTLAEKAKSGAESVSLHTSGSNAGDGFASGLSNAWGKVRDAASSLASRAKGIIDKVLDIHSPSRVLRKTGNYFGQGFALGIDDQNNNVNDSAMSLAQAAVSAMASATDEVNKMLEDNLNWNPTITPVIDDSGMVYPNMPGYSGTWGIGINGSIPLVQNGSSSQIVNNTEVHNDQQIHITQQPGESPELLAKRVEEALMNRTY